MRTDLLKKIEWAVAILLSVTVLFFLVVRATHAGGLWRDECGTMQLASMPTLSDVIDYFDHQTFPPLVPLVVRAYVKLFGRSDAALRCFGLLAGLTFLCAAWFNARAAGKGVPLLLLALCGLSPAFLSWGTTVGGYGFGACLIVLAFAMAAKFLRTPTPAVIGFLFVAALISQQFCIGNLTLALVIGLSALVVALIRHAFKSAIILTVLTICCALIGALYLKIFSAGAWRIVLRESRHLPTLWHEFTQALGGHESFIVVILASFATALIAGLSAVIKKNPVSQNGQSTPLPFALLVVLVSPVAYFTTLWLLSYRAHPWHYLLLLALVAAAIDMILLTASRQSWSRITHLALAVIAAVVMTIPAWSATTQRQSNMNVVATKVAELAKPADLIVVAPWPFGISFNWYYHGRTPWITLPAMADHRFHRYDLMLAKMTSPNPIDDVLHKIHQTLASGNRVWLVGGIRLPAKSRAPLSTMPAPDPRFGWDSTAYTESWVEQMSVFVAAHMQRADGIEVGAGERVNAFENVPLAVVEGWEESTTE